MKRLVPLFCLFLIAGCARLNPPAPVTYYGTQAGRSSDVMVVRDGDTVYTLAKLFSVSIRDLMDINGLNPPYNLTTGQVLKIPIPNTYKVEQSDTLYGISRAFGVDQTELARLNNLSAPYNLELDQELRLPYRGPKRNRTATAPSRSFWSSARDKLYGDQFSDDIDTTVSQDTVAVPRQRRGSVEVEELAPPPSNNTPSTVSKSPTSITSKPIETVRLEPQKPASSPKKVLPTGTPRFSWPVQGAVLSDYGPKSGGRHNDGLNIGAPAGTAVRAAEAGEVVYAGNELAGFGNLVLVRHAQGWMTAYGHMNKATVKRGAVVKKGQTLGAVGKTGSVKAPQLHFEIRKGSKALNPKKYLP